MQKIAKFFVYIGRFMLVASLVAQAVIFSMYPSIYYKKESFVSLIVLVLPTLIAYGVISYNSDDKPTLNRLWIVWGFYVSTFLIPMVGLIFGGLRENLDKNQFFGPNILKITMCGSALIALLLVSTSLTTKSDDQNKEKYKDLMIRLCWDIAMDLFDDIEMLEMILPQKESLSIPLALDAIIIMCVFLSFIFSIFETYEQALTVEDPSKSYIHVCRLGIQMLLVNVVLLVIRLLLWLRYKHDASIFIAKNAMKIWISILEILKHFGFYDDEAIKGRKREGNQNNAQMPNDQPRRDNLGMGVPYQDDINI
ncbi:uncharacterized protein LOC116295279 [Actinia tenebrosa]|uniref:Uncharacterized protein LOC116295279 n=1 Tax=Actinia tenebrosa TaxID=6105 RepID=A0A6P8HU39_ACTTE|nr:uncharacterized protein LOC116295279 [Actinia tenebrosa]